MADPEGKFAQGPVKMLYVPAAARAIFEEVERELAARAAADQPPPAAQP